ncbi:hypothetical protein FOXG_22346 [Fusarium oxysporum f. sp. lycopersici 4287]|uniref:Uncharacterized protein n=1 Tax=Fusarium oxysporum f. sp. lycopersici (strain 4287 / CBS 123668 / FGSC 9935 / NRRL 34936) TaxID=426428 RepID=A0A0J9W6P4_FUSO4|nr:hypothetical protein FOXG_22346 [Fusarium oxysporum f. sp. lycopersici 4287]KNB18724.1 hypothetical protein FOXG_22346 [Fusarium oxysporum f. sp. lycopersici 4287]
MNAIKNSTLKTSQSVMSEHLSVTAILSGMADALPTHLHSDDSSDLASSYEAIALLIHSYLAALGFKLQGFDEDKKLPECESLAPRLPPQWNSGLDSYSFLYSYKQSAMALSIRVNPMGKKVEIQGLAVGDDNICRFDRSIGELVKSDKLPIRITIKDNEEDRNILHDLKLHIIQKLIPKLQSKGYVEPAKAEANTHSESRAQVAQGPNRPCHGGPIVNSYRPPPPAIPHPEMARPQPSSSFEDEYEMHRPSRSGLQMPGRSPYNIGHDDLNPPGLGPHDPLRGSFTGGLPQPGGGSGMHPTFDDPLFGGQGDDGSSGFDPQVPPGARWDPTGPGGNPRFPGPSTGRGNNRFGGDII